MSFDALAVSWSRVLGVDRRQFNMFFERMMDGFAYHKIVLDQAGKPVDYVFLEVNSAFERLTGMKRENLIGKRVTEVLPGIERDPANWIGVYGKVALTGESVQFESYSASLDKWYSVSSYCPAKGYFVALFEDITNRKKVEDSLKMTLARFYNSLANMHGAVLLVSAEGKVEFANKSFCDYFLLKDSPAELEGLTSDEMIEKIKSAYSHSEEQVQRIREIVAGGKPVIGEEVEMQGDRTFLRDFIPLPLDDKSFSRLWYHVDITGRKKAEEALRASEENYRHLFQYAPTAIYEIDYNPPRFKSVNDAMCQLTGYTREELLAMSPMALLTVESQKRFAERIKKILAGEKIDEAVEFTTVIKDGRWLNVILYVKPSFKGGKLDGALIVGYDITERKQMEVKLEEYARNLEGLVEERTKQLSDERLRLYNVLETLPAYVILLDKDYRVPFANKVFRETFGESHGKRCYEYLFNKDHECENCETYKVYKQNKPQHWYWTGPNGHDYDIYDFPFKESDGSKLILEMGIDITERKKAEAQAIESARKLKDAERLAAIGATAGMVGHDIRNPLQAITGDIYLARSDVESMPPSELKDSLTESLESIQKSVDYVNKIILDLQDYSKSLKPVFQETNLHALIEDVIKRNGIPSNVKLARHLTKDAQTIKTDPDMLKRILGNLVSNSIQAMSTGGKLTIKATAKKENGNVVLTVRDTGVGIPGHAKANLFTPLFTTKSKGQGFGLAVVKRMTEALGGTVTFESEEGKGAEFTVTLPQ